jgi:hypothetical protein
MATNQGLRLFNYLCNRILTAAEYAAKANFDFETLSTTSQGRNAIHTVINNWSRGDLRLIWGLIYNRYAKMEKLNPTYTTMYAEKDQILGGGAKIGGGCDRLGYGTLMSKPRLVQLREQDHSRETVKYLIVWLRGRFYACFVYNSCMILGKKFRLFG